MLNGDPGDGFFYLTLMIDSYNLIKLHAYILNVKTLYVFSKKNLGCWACLRHGLKVSGYTTIQDFEIMNYVNYISF